MGLDAVDLVMEIESEFHIEIPNKVAVKIRRVGEMQDYIVQALRLRGETPDEERVWERLTAVVVRRLGVRPDRVTRSAEFVKDLHLD
jgi:acyl carrier protein